MVLTAKFPILIKWNLHHLFCPIIVGNIENSTWCVLFDRNFRMIVARSNSSNSFEIDVSVNISKGDIPLEFAEPEHCRTIILHGQKSVETTLYFSMFREVKGILSITQFLESSSKQTSTMAEVPVNSLTKSTPLLEENFKPLSEDFLRLLNNPDFFPDATLKCGAVKILVHKAILSVRSSVFAAMFKNQMQEGNSGIVEIVDIEPNVLQATLKCVYSGKTDHLTDDIAGDVLFAADKYQLEELKEVCIDKLKSNMTVENAFRILVLGDLHDESLKMHAKEFVCQCDTFSNLEKTEGWKSLQSENPGLAMEVLMFVVKNAQGCSTKSSVSK